MSDITPSSSSYSSEIQNQWKEMCAFQNPAWGKGNERRFVSCATEKSKWILLEIVIAHRTNVILFNTVVQLGLRMSGLKI